MIYATILNRISMMITDIKLKICLRMVPGTSKYTIRGFWRSAKECLRSNYVATHKLLKSLLGQHQIAIHSTLVIFNLQILKTHVPEIPTQCILVCPTEHSRKRPRVYPKFWLRVQYGVPTSHPFTFEDTSWLQTQVLLNTVK